MFLAELFALLFMVAAVLFLAGKIIIWIACMMLKHRMPGDKTENNKKDSFFEEQTSLSREVLKAHKILGVKLGDSFENITRVYREKARQNHPDLKPENKDSDMAEINRAYTLLKNLHQGK